MRKLAKKVSSYAQEQKPSSYRAQAYNISFKLRDLDSETSIAQMMIDDHNTICSALRYSDILVQCNIAVYIPNSKAGTYGNYIFFDGSMLTGNGTVINEWAVN